MQNTLQEQVNTSQQEHLQEVEEVILEVNQQAEYSICNLEIQYMESQKNNSNTRTILQVFILIVCYLIQYLEKEEIDLMFMVEVLLLLITVEEEVMEDLISVG